MSSKNNIDLILCFARIFTFLVNSVSTIAVATPPSCPTVVGYSDDILANWDDRKLEENPVNFYDNLSFLIENRRTDSLGGVDTFYSKKFHTRFYYSAQAPRTPLHEPQLVSPDAKAVVIFLHGSGTVKSSGKNFADNMNRLASIGVSSLAFDYPFHADGPISDNMNQLDPFMKWIDGIISDVKASGKPVYLCGHSFGPDVIWEYLYRYPNSVRGALMLSPAGYDDVLRSWYETNTSKMKFGGEVKTRELGSNWSGIIGDQIHNLRRVQRPDPTVINPDLSVRILWGAQEEYIPGPTGGSARTPIGDNTYDVIPILRSYFKNAALIREPGVGHYLFNHVDANGVNVIDREFAALLGLSREEYKKAAAEQSKRLAAMPSSKRLMIRLSVDRLLASYFAVKYTPKFFKQLAAGKIPENVIDRLLAKFDEDRNQRITEIIVEIENTRVSDPEFYQRNETAIIKLKNNRIISSEIIKLYLERRGYPT